ncbi:hypothetical protein, partial [Saccharopolyspora sp. NPDC002686]|uniref:hypothetical protein n=1 Tax=Saccharopolyspora sp. NPDC002686 TaxID=3154541 RepID=UPI0033299157
RADVGWVAQLAKAGLIKDLSDTPLAADTADFLPTPTRRPRTPPDEWSARVGEPQFQWKL